MYLLIAGCVVNIILDPILIFGLLCFPALGVAGAAIATVIGQISALLLYIIVYRRNSYAVHISFKHLVFDKAIIRQIYSVGIPSTVMMLLPSILISVLNSILTAFSDVYVAVLGVYFKLQTFTGAVIGPDDRTHSLYDSVCRHIDESLKFEINA